MASRRSRALSRRDAAKSFGFRELVSVKSGFDVSLSMCRPIGFGSVGALVSAAGETAFRVSSSEQTKMVLAVIETVSSVVFISDRECVLTVLAVTH